MGVLTMLVLTVLVPTVLVLTVLLRVKLRRQKVYDEQDSTSRFQALHQPTDSKRRRLEMVKSQTNGSNVEVVIGWCKQRLGDPGLSTEVPDNGVHLLLRQSGGASSSVVLRNHVF